jgi:hypothetical protein
MFYLVGLSVVLVSIFLYLLIELKRSIHLLYVIPLTIAFTLGSYFYLDSLFGYPVTKSNEVGFLLLSYHVGIEEEDIYLWVILKQETIPKAVVVPYSTEMHEKLEQAKQKMKEGRKITGEFTEGNAINNQGSGLDDGVSSSAGGTDKSRGGAFTLMELDLTSQLPPKDYLLPE